ncbi:MAG: hypothetical protein WBB45_18605 [Cyclobacteriaceae bacterium]
MKVFFMIIMSLMLSNCSANSQIGREPSTKLDSAFNYYFELFDLEVNKTPFAESRRSYYYSMVIDSNEVYILKDVSEAANILSDFSGIGMPYSDKSEGMLLTPEILASWQKWYKLNKDRIVWSKKKNSPILQKE